MIGRLVRLVLVVLVVVVVAFGAFVGWVGARGMPQRDGSASLPGLSADVTVKRDANGIAQIYASTPADLFAAEGYVHAQERMWQMEVWRHISSGTLAELFGASEVPTDEFIRTLGWRQSAQRDYDAADAGTKAILKAYASGVNAWLSQHHDLGLPFVISGFLGAGGGLSGYQPAPWTPVDTLAWVKVEAWQLGGNYDSEVFDLLLAKKVDAQAVSELSPPYPAGRPVIAPTGAPGVGGAGAASSHVAPEPAATSAPVAIDPRVLALAGDPTSLLGLEQASDHIAQLAGFGPTDPIQRSDGIGSNDWVVSGAHTASGSALLANDPHLGYAMPSIWYMVGLHCTVVSSACPYDVAGVSFPGGPGVILGHNAHIAWGFTNVNPDVQDLFMEKVDPADPARYEYKGQMVPFTTRTEVIKVAGGEPVTITVRSTVHGPVVSDAADDLKATADGGSGLAGDDGVVYSLRWTSTAVVDTTLEALLKLDAATDFDTFRAALRLYIGPSQNVVYADTDGHIGYQMPGLVPVRAAGDGSGPVPGWDGSHDWTGYVPYDDLPRIYDPPSGVIVTANNAAVDSSYPYALGDEWDPGYRAARITALIGTDTKLTMDDVSRIQLDGQTGIAMDIVPHLGTAAPSTDDGKVVLAAIQAWATVQGTPYDCSQTDSSPASLGCAAFNAFAYHLLRDVFDPRLGAGTDKTDIARLYVGSDRSAETLVNLLGDAKSRWWDDPSTPAHETEASVIAKALDQAGADLRSTLGEPSAWTWGALHTVAFQEQTLGTSGIGPLEWLFDKGPYPDGGSVYAVNQQYFDLSAAYPDPYADDPAASGGTFADVFAVKGGPSYRLVVETAQLDGATIVDTTGQSGVPFDAHYGDLIDTYLAGKTVPLPFTTSAVDEATTQILTLTPVAAAASPTAP
ncbi:MAG TPA: penicillin acylase family protein [Candidatus Sulfotelmatobacter sp.]|nr:penicillin acylase family protein [Candidatus Sulfotelmatobacter sp.]